MSIGERVKRARKRAGLTQTQLGELVGVRQATISELEKGDSRSSAYLLQIARACGVSADWLAEGRGEMDDADQVISGPPPDATSDFIFHEPVLVEDDEPLRPDEVEIPCFREIEFSAGDGRTQVVENHGHRMRFPLAKLAARGVSPQMAACATASGTSMEPRIMDGSTIAIDKSCTHIIDGKVYALDHGGMLRVKKLYRLPLDRIRLVSENDDEFPDEIYHMSSEEAPRIIGRVFWWEVFD